jgi:phosphomethylpyrimidine synthase
MCGPKFCSMKIHGHLADAAGEAATSAEAGAGAGLRVVP